MGKILLIPSLNMFAQKIVPHIPLGLLSIKAVSMNYNDMIDIMPMDDSFIEKKFSCTDELVSFLIKKIDLNKYDTVGLSTICHSFHHSLRIAQDIKQKNPEIDIWMGGPHASVVGKEILKSFEYVDAIFIGESELTINEVLKNRLNGIIDYKKVPGILSRENEYIQRQQIKNLDTLPWICPDKDYKDYWNCVLKNSRGYEPKIEPQIPIEATRGCSGKCKFCSTSLYWGSCVRRKSDMRIISEMRNINKHMDNTSFGFIGDNFGDSRINLIKFCNKIAHEEPDFTWCCSIKLDNLILKDLETLWQGGCRGFFVGVESASQDTLNKMQKGVKLTKRLELIQKAVDIGFSVETAFIIGFPWETLDDINLTFQLQNEMLNSGVKRTVVQILCPLPGTEFAREYPVQFDRITSTFTFDGIPFDEKTRELISEYPELFLQFGHFETPHINRIDLEAIVDTVIQLNHMK